jgi:DNA modification methylase
MTTLKDLKPDTKNARKHNPRNIGMIADALREVGAARSGVIDEDGNILAGNGTYEALAEAGIEKVKIVEADGNEWVVVKRSGLTKKEKAKLALYDNRTAELADWDIDNLGLLDDEHENIFDNIFSQDELDELFGDDSGPGELEGEDDAPEPPVEPTTKLGDMYQLGDHFLLCGNSTDKAQVDRLMDGQKADMVFTDPPYGINEKTDRVFASRTRVTKGNSFPKIIGDKSIDTALIAFEIANSLSDIVCYWGGNYFSYKLPPSPCWIVWDKRVEDKQRDVNSDCELAYIKHPSKKSVRIFRHLWKGMIKGSENGQRRIHPTQKPIALAEWCFIELDKEGRSVVDLFGGSGSTMIACEKMNRKCYMMEIDPAYCDVIVERYRNLFPEKEICLMKM